MERKHLLAMAAGLATVIATWSPALAITVEVPVVGLDGYFYGPDTTRVTGSFTVNFESSDILSARIRITGNLVWPSYYGCPYGDAGVNGLKFFANMSTASGDWFTETVYVDQRVLFVTYLFWQPSGGATWDFLSGKSGTLVLSGFARPLPEGCTYNHGSSDTTGEVADAEIIFELRDPNPVEQSTWGRVKALFHHD